MNEGKTHSDGGGQINNSLSIKRTKYRKMMIDGWMDRWMGVWMGVCVDGWIDRLTEKGEGGFSQLAAALVCAFIL